MFAIFIDVNLQSTRDSKKYTFFLAIISSMSRDPGDVAFKKLGMSKKASHVTDTGYVPRLYWSVWTV